MGETGTSDTRGELEKEIISEFIERLRKDSEFPKNLVERLAALKPSEISEDLLIGLVTSA